MSYRMTSNAPTIGEFVDRLDALADAYIDAVIGVGTRSVEAHTPRDRGNLVAWLSQNKREGSGTTAHGWVGPLTGLDIEQSVVGNGYLRRFVTDYIGEGAYRPFWDALSPAERDALQAGRESGNEAWGGKVINAMYAPRYMAAVDRGIVPAGTTGFHAQHRGFVQRIINQTVAMAGALAKNLPTNMAVSVRTDYA